MKASFTFEEDGVKFNKYADIKWLIQYPDGREKAMVSQPLLLKPKLADICCSLSEEFAEEEFFGSIEPRLLQGMPLIGPDGIYIIGDCREVSKEGVRSSYHYPVARIVVGYNLDVNMFKTDSDIKHRAYYMQAVKPYIPASEQTSFKQEAPSFSEIYKVLEKYVV